MQMTVLEQVRRLEQEVLERLKDLEPLLDEYQQLCTRASRLGLHYTPGQERQSANRPDGTRVTSRSRTRGGLTKATAGSRRADVQRLVAANPGITVTRLGQELGVDPTGLYRVVRGLAAEGVIVKDGVSLTIAG